MHYTKHYTSTLVTITTTITTITVTVLSVRDGRDPEYIDGIKIRKKGWKEQSDVEAQLRLAEAQLKEVQAVEAYDDAIRLNNFAVNRKLSTKPEHIKSINNWHKGVHYPCDLTSGFPHGFGDINTRPRDTTIDIDTPFVKYDSNKYSSKEYVPTDGTGDFEAEFNKYFNEICYQRACAYLEVHCACFMYPCYMALS